MTMTDLTVTDKTVTDTAMADSLEQQARPRPSEERAAAVWDVAATVLDPELPVLTIEDLGILRDARIEVVDGPDGEVETAVVTITPTYSGCPAMDTMADDVTAALAGAGYPGARVEFVLSPAWTTDWMSQAGRDKLTEYGITPPTGNAAAGKVHLQMAVKCPQCNSLKTRELARFGSTSCKALYQCQACQEPFDYFKVL